MIENYRNIEMFIYNELYNEVTVCTTCCQVGQWWFIWSLRQLYFKCVCFIVWKLRKRNIFLELKVTYLLCYRSYIFNLILCRIWVWIYIFCAIYPLNTVDLIETNRKKEESNNFFQQVEFVKSDIRNADTDWNSIKLRSIAISFILLTNTMN